MLVYCVSVVKTHKKWTALIFCMRFANQINAGSFCITSCAFSSRLIWLFFMHPKCWIRAFHDKIQQLEFIRLPARPQQVGSACTAIFFEMDGSLLFHRLEYIIDKPVIFMDQDEMWKLSTFNPFQNCYGRAYIVPYWKLYRGSAANSTKTLRIVLNNSLDQDDRFGSVPDTFRLRWKYSSTFYA